MRQIHTTGFVGLGDLLEASLPNKEEARPSNLEELLRQAVLQDRPHTWSRGTNPHHHDAVAKSVISRDLALESKPLTEIGDTSGTQLLLE